MEFEIPDEGPIAPDPRRGDSLAKSSPIVRGKVRRALLIPEEEPLAAPRLRPLTRA
ncbi:MAG: hypothetical protein JF593_13145 [Novosphingobium sp.]|nr:hypothetical protein [Novosphingobium sp.]